MRWIVVACAGIAGLLTEACVSGPSTRPAAERVEMVDLVVVLPVRGWDGDWMFFHHWVRERPTAEDCTEEVAPFLVPRGITNLALHRPVTSSEADPLIGRLEAVTDGVKKAFDDHYVELGPNLQWVQIDLGRSHRIHAVLAWHTAGFPSLHKDFIVQLSDDEEFEKGVHTIFNNDRDNSAGLGYGTDREYFQAVGTKVIDAKGIAARYVRLYSGGNIGDGMNSYVEVEVYGLLAPD